jgi:hypothetical protein
MGDTKPGTATARGAGQRYVPWADVLIRRRVLGHQP